jgi:hypothetical protein
MDIFNGIYKSKSFEAEKKYISELLKKHTLHDRLGLSIDKGLQKPLEKINKNRCLYTSSSCSGHSGSPYIEIVFKDLKTAKKYLRKLKKTRYKLRLVHKNGEITLLIKFPNDYKYKIRSDTCGGFEGIFKDAKSANSFKKIVENKDYPIQKTKSRYYIEVPIYNFRFPNRRKSCKLAFKKLAFAKKWQQELENRSKFFRYNVCRVKHSPKDFVYIVDLPLPPNENYKPATPKQSKKFWKDITKILSDEKIAGILTKD